jgi:hypothetical protein
VKLVDSDNGCLTEQQMMSILEITLKKFPSAYYSIVTVIPTYFGNIQDLRYVVDDIKIEAEKKLVISLFS